MIDILTKEFTGKGEFEGKCCYLTDNGKKCAVGCFIPDGHEGQNFEGTAADLMKKYHELKLPLSKYGLMAFQNVHDKMSSDLDKDTQLDILIDWIKTNVVD